jgi:hypothetical protein
LQQNRINDAPDSFHGGEVNIQNVVGCMQAARKIQGMGECTGKERVTNMEIPLYFLDPNEVNELCDLAESAFEKSQNSCDLIE